MGKRADQNGPAPARRPDCYLNVVRGLEEIAVSELSQLDAEVLPTRPSKVFFSCPGDPRRLLDLRSAMHIYAFVVEHTGCPHDSSAQAWLERIARQLDLGPALALHAAVHGTVGTPSFRITGARSGRHEYTSPEIAAWVGTGVQAQTSWPVDLEHYDYDIEVELVDDRALFGLRLGARWRERHAKPVYHPASLNPTVAYAMIALIGRDADDTFLDPACGGGTLLTERAALGRARLILGGDIWPTALQYASATLTAAKAPAALVHWDAGHLPLLADSVDRIASNLPFGHRVGSGPVARSFYRRLLPEICRVLRPGGAAALLTSRRRWLRQTVSDNPGLRPDRCLRLILGGKEAFIFLLSRAG
ncbi:MAG: methyltransferase domain-containing protein [Armatimonadota bacterium]|nr:MAG: methyltransferase domain-containing protein [Armatimonadota bacterium]